jgi:type IV secretory pathway VirB4 component
MWLLNKSKQKTTSRRQIQIKEVKDGVITLPNNQYRAVLETSSINFELKSEAEQDVIIDSFQNFLNSLSFPVQILVRVREIDIDQYIEQILVKKDKEKEEAYKTQIQNYAEFIRNLVSGNKILARHFYFVIAFVPDDRKQDFDLTREQIRNREDIVVKGLEKIGMKVNNLDSLQVLQLFYNFYNPSQSKSQPLKEIKYYA